MDKVNGSDLQQPLGDETNTPELEKYLSLVNTLKGFEEFSLDKDGVIISTNLEAVNITGYEEHEVIGKHFGIFYLADERHKASLDLERAAKKKQVVVTGMRLKKRGATFWAKIDIQYIPQRLSKALFRVTMQDATHRAISNIRTRTIRDEYLTIFNNPFVGVFKFRISDYRMLMCNEKTLEITAHTHYENLLFCDLFRSSAQFDQFIALLHAEKKVDGFKFLINDNKPESENWGLLSARCFSGQGFVEGVLMDISEQYHQMLELERVNLALDSFIYHASHDLRAPLTSIIGLINLGVRENSIEAAHSYLEMIRGRVSHLDILLKDLISISFNSKADIIPETFEFGQEVAMMLADHDSKIHPIEVVVTVDQPSLFSTDKVRARTILRNLISNAFKYYNPDETKSVIRIEISVNEDNASVMIMDNGIGVESVYKGKIFDMFFRATTRSVGTGLGLYIVKCMVDKLRGQISFESNVGAGTTFFLTLPNEYKITDRQESVGL